MSEARKRFIKALTTGLTIGMLSTTGCGLNNPFSTQSKEAKFATEEQNDMNEFMDNYTQSKLEEMKKIIDETEKQNQQLKNDRDKAKKYGQQEADLYTIEQRFIENELSVMNNLYTEKGGNTSGGNKPASTSIFTQIVDGVTNVVDWIEQKTSGNPSYDAAVSAADYAYANPDWDPIAQGFISMYQGSTNETFQYDPATKTDPSKDKNEQDQSGTSGQGITANGVVQGIAGVVEGAANTIAEKGGEIAGTAAAAAERANDEYNKQVQTDAYGNYVTVDPESLADQEKMQKLYEEGKIEVIPDPLNNGEYIWVYTEEGQEQEDDYERG